MLRFFLCIIFLCFTQIHAGFDPESLEVITPEDIFWNGEHLVTIRLNPGNVSGDMTVIADLGGLNPRTFIIPSATQSNFRWDILPVPQNFTTICTSSTLAVTFGGKTTTVVVRIWPRVNLFCARMKIPRGFDLQAKDFVCDVSPQGIPKWAEIARKTIVIDSTQTSGIKSATLAFGLQVLHAPFEVVDEPVARNVPFSERYVPDTPSSTSAIVVVNDGVKTFARIVISEPFFAHETFVLATADNLPHKTPYGVNTSGDATIGSTSYPRPKNCPHVNKGGWFKSFTPEDPRYVYRLALINGFRHLKVRRSEYRYFLKNAQTPPPTTFDPKDSRWEFYDAPTEILQKDTCGYSDQQLWEWTNPQYVRKNAK